jgi:fatty acid desaturase
VIDGPVPGTGDGWAVEIVILTIAVAAVVAAIGFVLGYMPAWVL